MDLEAKKQALVRFYAEVDPSRTRAKVDELFSKFAYEDIRANILLKYQRLPQGWEDGPAIRGAPAHALSNNAPTQMTAYQPQGSTRKWNTREQIEEAKFAIPRAPGVPPPPPLYRLTVRHLIPYLEDGGDPNAEMATIPVISRWLARDRAAQCAQGVLMCCCCQFHPEDVESTGVYRCCDVMCSWITCLNVVLWTNESYLLCKGGINQRHTMLEVAAKRPKEKWDVIEVLLRNGADPSLEMPEVCGTKISIRNKYAPLFNNPPKPAPGPEEEFTRETRADPTLVVWTRRVAQLRRALKQAGLGESEVVAIFENRRTFAEVVESVKRDFPQVRALPRGWNEDLAHGIVPGPVPPNLRRAIELKHAADAEWDKKRTEIAKQVAKDFAKDFAKEAVKKTAEAAVQACVIS